MIGHSFFNILKSKKSGMTNPENRSDVVFGKERHVPAQEKPNTGGIRPGKYRNKDFLYIHNYKPNYWSAGTGKLGYTNYPNQWYADCDREPTKNYIINNKDKDKEHRQAFQLSFAKRPKEELYDLKNDPDQLNNVAKNPTYTEILENMRVKLQENLISLNDPRARNFDYNGFDNYPYLGKGGERNSKYQVDVRMRMSVQEGFQ